MSFDIREVWVVLTTVLILLAAKRVPALEWMPLTKVIGILCFSFAIYLCWGIRNQLISDSRA